MSMKLKVSQLEPRHHYGSLVVSCGWVGSQLVTCSGRGGAVRVCVLDEVCIVRVCV